MMTATEFDLTAVTESAAAYEAVEQGDYEAGRKAYSDWCNALTVIIRQIAADAGMVLDSDDGRATASSRYYSIGTVDADGMRDETACELRLANHRCVYGGVNWSFEIGDAEKVIRHGLNEVAKLCGQ